jgi:zinc transporter
LSILADHPHGLLWAYRFCDGAAESMLGAPAPPDLRHPQGWVWAHFPLRDQRARAFLMRLAELPDDARELLLGADCAPRILFAGRWAFGVLPDFERAFEGHATGFGRLRFAFDETRLITTRAHALQVVDDMHRSLASGRTFCADPLHAFIALNRRYCEVAEDQLDALADRLDHFEDQVLGSARNLERIELGPMRRDLSRRHRDLAALRTAYHRAASRQAHAHDHPLTPHLPALVQLTEDVDREIIALQDRARLIHEEIDTKITSATNRTLRALTLMSALMMPPTLAVGAFGMNVGGIWFAHEAQGFALAFGVCAVSAVIAYAVLSRLGVLK